MKITILALHLGYGGVEKFITNIANMFAKDNEVQIISTYKIFEKPAFTIDPNVKITYLLEDLKPNREEFYRSVKNFKIIDLFKESIKALRILYLRRSKMRDAIKEITEGTVISTRPFHNKLLAKYGKNELHKIATEHNYDINNNTYIRKTIQSCKGIEYLVIASKELFTIYSNMMENNKCKVINIPLNLDCIPSQEASLDSKEITYIGRLSKEKGTMDLIEVFKKVYDKEKDAILNIIGEGEEEENIRKKVKEYNLTDNVIFHGYKSKNDSENILLNTSVGINTSYTESFGLAILETMSYGIPCIAFSSASGLKEIIENERNGYIIENRDYDIMADKIVQLLNDKERIKQLAKKAKETSLMYKEEEIKKKWMQII